MPRYKTFTLDHSYLYLTDQKMSELINLYCSHEVLWNSNLDTYNKKKPRMEAINKIAKILNVEFFGPKQVNTKLMNLRNIYCQERKKKLLDRNYIPVSAWYNKLDWFLRPHVKLRPIHKGQLIDNDESDEFGENSNSGSHLSDMCNNSLMVKPETSQDQKESGIVQDSDSDSSEQEVNSDHQDTETSSMHNFFDKSVPKTLKSISEQLEKLQPKEQDTYEEFGLHVASLLRDLPRKKTLILQPQIVNVIVVAIAEELTENELRTSQIF